MNVFSERVKAILQEKKMSQAELAALSGVTTPSLCRYLRGNIDPRIDVVRNIARVLGVSEAYLLGATNDDRRGDERQQIKQLIARNRHLLTKEDRSEIIALLYGENDG